MINRLAREDKMYISDIITRDNFSLDMYNDLIKKYSINTLKEAEISQYGKDTFAQVILRNPNMNIAIFNKMINDKISLKTTGSYQHSIFVAYGNNKKFLIDIFEHYYDNKNILSNLMKMYDMQKEVAYHILESKKFDPRLELRGQTMLNQMFANQTFDLKMFNILLEKKGYRYDESANEFNNSLKILDKDKEIILATLCLYGDGVDRYINRVWETEKKIAQLNQLVELYRATFNRSDLDEKVRYDINLHIKKSGIKSIYEKVYSQIYKDINKKVDEIKIELSKLPSNYQDLVIENIKNSIDVSPKIDLSDLNI
jgi:hypothetical protein